MVLKNGYVFTESGIFQKTDLTFEETIQRIGSAGEEDGARSEDCTGLYVVPGLVDLHTHGAIGEDASDGSEEGLTKLSRYYAENGITSWCPTTMTVKEEELAAAMKAIRNFRTSGARCVGIHLEGPFISYEKRGAQNAENLRLPDLETVKRLDRLSGGQIRLITAAPELVGGFEFIRQAASDYTVSVGHTAAGYETAVSAFRAGASHVTHLFNGMNPMLSREPGVLGAAYDSGAVVELICDGLHVHPSFVRMIYRLFEGRVAMISDSLRCTGMPDGEYMLGGQKIIVKERRAMLSDERTLAGSSINLMEALRRVVSFGIPLEKALLSATAVPAGELRLQDQIGVLKAGAFADIAVLDRKLNLRDVYVGGRRLCLG